MRRSRCCWGIAGCYPADGGRAPIQAYCSRITRNSTDGFINNIIDTNLNAGSEFQDGLDLSVRYNFPTPIGRFGASFDGTWLHRFNITDAASNLIKARGTFDGAGSNGSLAGTGGVYPAFKFLTGVTYSIAGFGAGATVRFIGSFSECGDPAGDYSGFGLCYIDRTFKRQVDAYATLDLFASYAFQTGFDRTSVGVGVNNVLDKKPSNIYNGFAVSTDPSAYDLVGRFFYARIAQAF